MKRSTMIMVLVFGILADASLQAHGVEHHILQGGVGVEVHHEVLVEGDAEIPLAGAEVQIYKPGTEDQPFQTGQTDIHGIFMFNPDTSGVWTVHFLNENGHGKVVELTINELNVVELDEHHGPSTWRDVISGIGFILFGFALWIVFKKKT